MKRIFKSLIEEIELNKSGSYYGQVAVCCGHGNENLFFHKILGIP